MWALGRAEVGAVTALRETSIVFSSILGTWFLKERKNPARYAAAGLVVAGIAAISMAR
jgi:drug/metabolite transporter (DMT)-like permease